MVTIIDKDYPGLVKKEVSTNDGFRFSSVAK